MCVRGQYGIASRTFVLFVHDTLGGDMLLRRILAQIKDTMAHVTRHHSATDARNVFYEEMEYQRHVVAKSQVTCSLPGETRERETSESTSISLPFGLYVSNSVDRLAWSFSGPSQIKFRSFGGLPRFRPDIDPKSTRNRPEKDPNQNKVGRGFTRFSPDFDPNTKFGPCAMSSSSALFTGDGNENKRARVVAAQCELCGADPKD
eukprot:179020-Amphidinium_carterae.1